MVECGHALSPSVLIPLAVMAAFIAGSFAKTTTELIKPIRPQGDEVALIFVPGAFLYGWQFNETAKAIQEASQLRVWAVLTGGYTRRLANPQELPGAIEASIKVLKQAGFASDNIIGIGHSLGGIQLGAYGRKPESPLKALVVMGSFVGFSETSLSDYPLPFLTLSGELDVRMRILRVSEYYANLQHDAKQSKDAIYRTPVIIMKGTNHMQFETGPGPAQFPDFDIPSDVPNDVAHRWIGEHVNSFLTYRYSSEATDVKNARKHLEKSYVETGKILQPIYDMKAVQEKNNGSCPWARVSQEYIAGQYADVIEVNNKILKLPEFSKSKPSMAMVGDKLVINTTTVAFEYEENYRAQPWVYQSPKELKMKLKSKESIAEILGQYPPSQEPPCEYLNKLALGAALHSSRAAALKRYKQRGKPIIFEKDITAKTEQDWMSSSLKSWVDHAGRLHVRSGDYITHPKDSEGVHYCGLLDPLRALEWVLIDSLRPPF